MTLLCLLLAAAALVLSGIPQVCRCDRPQHERARAPNDDDIDGNTWTRIIDQQMLPDVNLDNLQHRDESNLISATGTLYAIPKLPWYPAGTHSNDPTILESLLNRYRKYMVEKIGHFNDACSVLEDDSDDEVEPLAADGEFIGRTDISVGGRTTESAIEDSRGSPSALKLFRNMKIKLPKTLTPDLCSRNAKHYYHCFLARVRDQQLIQMVQDYLEAKCYRHDLPRGPAMAAIRKRETPRYVSKQKFHSWGGKRNNAHIFYPWGGKRSLARSHKLPKVVIRNPFHSWGGKRNGP